MLTSAPRSKAHHAACQYFSDVARRRTLLALIGSAACLASFSLATLPHAHAAPAPEVEYVYDVAVRRHYNFPNNDAIGYGYGLCDRITRGESYAQIMADVKDEVTPNDEASAGYLVSYSVGILCPAQIWQLRKSAAGYTAP
jgi:hypothetical protein